MPSMSAGSNTKSIQAHHPEHRDEPLTARRVSPSHGRRRRRRSVAIGKGLMPRHRERHITGGLDEQLDLVATRKQVGRDLDRHEDVVRRAVRTGGVGAAAGVCVTPIAGFASGCARAAAQKVVRRPLSALQAPMQPVSPSFGSSSPPPCVVSSRRRLAPPTSDTRQLRGYSARVARSPKGRALVSSTESSRSDHAAQRSLGRRGRSQCRM